VRDLRSVIFDCDGVLVDSEVISNSVLAANLTAAGVPTTLAQARRDYQGLLLAEVVDMAERRLGHPLPKTGLPRSSANGPRRFSVN
jgi:beta-phosphoglucomutase-like phosphatase (HAD superfamily)